MSCIYIIRNTENSKVYIGQTIHTAEERFAQHIWKARGNSIKTKLCMAMNDIGIDKFFVETLINCDRQELNKYEQLYVKKYNSVTHGYNSVYPCSVLDVEHEMEYADTITNMIEDGYSIASVAKYINTSAKYIYSVIKKYDIKRENSDKYINSSAPTPVIMYDKQFNPICRHGSKKKDALRWLTKNTTFSVSSFGAYYYIEIACKNGNIAYGYRWQLESELYYENKRFRTSFDKDAYINGGLAYKVEGKDYYVVDGALSNIKTIHKENKCIDCGRKISYRATRCIECNNKVKNEHTESYFVYRCIQCGRVVAKQNTLCVSCANVIAKGKSPKPTKEKLKDLIDNKNTIKQIADMYGRTESTVYYWIKAYKLR